MSICYIINDDTHTPLRYYAGVRDVGVAWSALLPDPAHGARRPSWRFVEAAGLGRLGASPGTFKLHVDIHIHVCRGLSMLLC